MEGRTRQTNRKPNTRTKGSTSNNALAPKTCTKTLSNASTRRMGYPPQTQAIDEKSRNPTTRNMAQAHNNDSKRRAGWNNRKEQLFSRTPPRVPRIHNAEIKEPPLQDPYRRNADTQKFRICAKTPETPLRGHL